MKQRAMLLSVGLVVLVVSLLAFPQTETVTGTITLTIPPALELQLPGMSQDLYLAAGTSAEMTIDLAVGTNDWPLDLHFSLISSSLESALAFEYSLKTEDEAQTSPSWTQIPALSLSPPLLLPSSAGWTSYTLSVRATAQENASPGTYLQSVRMILRSTAGLIEIRDIPVSVTVLPGESASVMQAEGMGGASPLSSSISPFNSANIEGNSNKCEQVLIITWEGVTVASLNSLPGGTTNSE